MRIYVLTKWIEDNLTSREIINLYNQYADRNNYTRIDYTSEIDYLLTGGASEIISEIDTDNFNINDDYMVCHDLYGYQTFNYYDDDNSPVDLKEIADYIIRNDECLENSDVYAYVDGYKESYREIKELLESNRYEDIIVEFFDNDWHFNGNEKELYRILYGFLEQNEDISKEYLADVLSEVIDDLIAEDNNK